MGRKGLIALLALLLGCVLGYLALDRQQQQNSAPVAAAPWLAAEQDYLASLQALDIQAPGQPPVRVERRSEAWVVPAKADYPAAPQALAELLRNLREARVVEAKTANPQWHARLGLAEQGGAGEQATRLTLHFAGHADLGLRIGKPASQGGGQLVRRAGEDQVWLVDRSLTPPQQELDWLDRRVSEIPFTDIQRVQLEHADGERLTLSKREAQQEGGFSLSATLKGKTYSAENVGNAIAAVFSALQFEDAAPLAQIGFAKAPLLKLSLSSFSGQQLQGGLYRQGEQHWLVLSQAQGFRPGEVSAHSDWAYRLQPEQAQRLLQKWRDLQPKS